MGTHRGKILDVDLSSGTVKTTTIDDDTLRKYIGGSGLAAKLFLDRVPPDVDPLGEKNIFFVMTGPLAGTTTPAGNRWTVSFKSPLTGAWGEACSGGNVAPEIKGAGYDGIAVSGVSSKPVYLLIDDDKVEIRDASDLWGKDVYETTDILKGKIEGTKKVKVISIGPAGENLVKFASVHNDKADAAARTGGGAVMGSKKLKAIVVRGTGKVEPGKPDEYKEVRKAVFDKVNDGMISMALRAQGTAMGMGVGAMLGDVPTKNWTVGDPGEIAKKTDGDALAALTTKNHACTGCPIASKRVVKVAEGPYKIDEGPGPEYETLAAFGAMLMHDNLEAILKINELCNRYGVDTISCGGTIAFAMECFDKGLITTSDLDGGQLRWGNTDDIMAMLDMIVFRKGFGDVLAEGSRGAAQKIGKNASDYVVTVKGLEAAMHDPRAGHGLGLSYATSNRGACHVESSTLYIEQNWVTLPEVGLTGGYDAKSADRKVEVVVTAQNLGSLCNAMVLCEFAANGMTVDDQVDIMRTTTGFDYDLKEFMEAGERIWLLKRGLNNLMGITSKDDCLPKNIMTAVQDGGAAGSVPDMDKMLKEYYPARGLDANGRVTKEKLTSLGLSDLAAKM
ncbi:MAG: aldehyde ferredoxin oxidoreductase family protein [Dehalococcoidia bacterium]